MYFFLLEAILDQHREQPVVMAERQPLCATLVDHPEQFSSVQPLTFRVDPLVLQRDYIGVTNVPGGILCSQTFLTLLSDAKADFFAFPALLRDQDGNQEISSAYQFTVIRRYEGAIDWKRSESWIDAEAERNGHYMTKLVLAEEYERRNIPIFRLEHTLLTVVHEHLRTKLEQAKLVGLAFAPLHAVYSPYQGVRILELESLLRKRPNNAKRWSELGSLLVSVFRFQEALMALDRALAIDPTIGRAWYLRGLALSRLGRQQEALEAYQKATVLNESGAWIRLSELLRRLGRMEEAFSLNEHYRGSVWEKGRPFWCERGEIFLALGQEEEALAAFEQAILLPGTGKDAAFCGKGTALFRLGRYEEALDAYCAGLEASSLDIDSQKRGLWHGKATVLRALGRFEEAVAAEQQLRELEQEREFRMHAKPL